MNDFKLLAGSDTIKSSRERLNNNFQSVASDFSGTAFPTENLLVGMSCYRTDEKKLYKLCQLGADSTLTWTCVMDFSGGSAVIPISSGGTGATTAEAARDSLGLSFLCYSGAGAHNAVYRGKSLGSAVTDAQWAAIKAGTFDDLYIGDYWTINGVNWDIAAFDYYLNCGDTATTAHHVTIVPRSILYSAQMHNTSSGAYEEGATANTTEGAYVGSDMYKTNLETAKTTISNAFGSAHILAMRCVFQYLASNGYEATQAWYDASVWLMSEASVYGCNFFKNQVQGTNFAWYSMTDNSQYPLFAHNPTRIKTRQAYWLRDVASATAFADVHGHGRCSAGSASDVHGVRPAFNIYQS